ncbi:MAG: hypothetical protein LBQ83_06425 [Candidatus Margulisbacteria bacterium]|jgi:hypothetical protein|nr:hypothetical protein [Candidatus Margulisiibacteriota bacterium]
MIKTLKKNLFCLFLPLLWACALAGPKEAYGVESLLIGAEAMGRGGAYLGSGDSGSPVFQNFAAVTGPRAALTVFKLINEINYLSAAYAQNGWGLGFLTVQDSAGYQRDEDNNLIGGKIGYSDSTVYGTYARELGRVNLGLRLKYTSRIMAGIDSAKGYSLDLGALYRLNEYWRFGGEVTNISFAALRWADGAQELFPVVGGLGVGYSVFGAEKRLNLYSDLCLESGGERWSGGLEWLLADLLTLRGGFVQSSFWQDETMVRQLKPAAGLGLNLGGLTFDYAYNPGDELAENITHYFTLGYRFGGDELPAAEQAEIFDAVQAEAAAIPEPAPEEEAEDAAAEAEPSPAGQVPAPARRRMFYDIDDLPPEEQAIIEDLGYLKLM